MDISVALGGGGAKGNAHIGVLRFLEKQGFRIRAIAGTSFGGMVACFYAAGFGPDEIEEIFSHNGWKSDPLRHIVRRGWHHLHQPNGADTGDSLHVILAFFTNNGCDQVRIHALSPLQLDRRQQPCRIGYIPERRRNRPACPL